MNSQKFPEEILFQIFGHLTIFDLHKNVALVCKKFSRITQSSRIVKKIRTNLDNTRTIQFYEKALEVHPYVEEIRILCNDLR